jgi:hypothetical protein
MPQIIAIAALNRAFGRNTRRLRRNRLFNFET